MSVNVQFAALGTLGGFSFPDIRRATANEIPGTLNLVRNPSVERDTADWSTAGGASMTRISTDYWHGGFCLSATLGTGTTSAVSVISQSGLGTTGGMAHGSLVVKATPVGATLQLVAVYTDGSTEAGDAEVVVPSAGWNRVFCSLVLSGTKTLDYMRMSLASGGTSGTAKLDAAQIEYDAGRGPTSFAIGDYGAPYHEWMGTSHLSPSIRWPIPVPADDAGSGGRVQIEVTMWRSNVNNKLIEDISRYVVSGTVNCDADRDVAWNMTCEMEAEGFGRLDPWHDWLSPILTIKVDGKPKRVGQLGHYVVLPSPATYNETYGTVAVDARSAEYLLSLQGTAGILTVKEGAHHTAVVRKLLNDTPIGRDRDGKDVRPRFDIPKRNKEFKRDQSWEKTDSLLSIINEVLEGAGCTPLYATGTGILTSVVDAKHNWESRAPVRLWATNVEPRQVLTKEVPERGVLSNEIIGTVSTAVDLGKAETEIVVVSANPKGKKIRVVRRLDDDDGATSGARRNHRHTKRKTNRHLPDVQTAEELADKLAREIGSKIETVTFTAIADPSVELLNEVIYLAIHDASGRKLAMGRYRVLSVEYGFTASEALMTVKAGFVRKIKERPGKKRIPIANEGVTDMGNVRHAPADVATENF